MSDSQFPEIPGFTALAADTEIAPLLDFQPVVRKVKRPDGWTPELQRELIARIAATGTVQQDEDADSLRRRAEKAKDSISAKLLKCRRLYLQEISSSPGKRAAFEILTGFAIDWDKAAALEAQADEPFRKPNMREPDMLLTAENGWMGDMAHGANRMAELRAELDKYREEEGLPPVDWESESTENSEQSQERHVSYSTDACPDRPAGRRASSEPSPSDGGGGFTPPKQPSSSDPSPSPDPQNKPGPRVRGL